MSNNRKWFNLSKPFIQIFPQSQISYQYKKLPLQYFHIALCPFSGPIAILYNKFLGNQINQIKLLNNYDKSIMIFNTKGQLMKIINFDMKDRVVLFKFTNLEELVIVYANGEYVIVDPFSSKRYSGTYFKDAYEINHTINQRCVGAVMDGNSCMYIMKQKQIGIIKSIRNTWSPLTNLKPNVQNPIFSVQSLKSSKKQAFLMNNTSYPIIYLSRDCNIEQFNPSTNVKRLLFQSQYLTKNYKTLLCITKRQNNLILIFKKPFKIFYIKLSQPLFNSNQQSFQLYQHDPILQLKQPIQISKKKSKHNYMSLNDQILWLGQSNNICIYNNGKILIFFDHQNMKVIYNPGQKDNKLLHSVVEEIDGVRVIGEFNEMYREVSETYQHLVSLQSLQQTQQKIYNFDSQHGQKLQHQLQIKFQSTNFSNQSSIQQAFQSLNTQQIHYAIHSLHSIYRSFLNKQLIPIQKLNQMKIYVSFLLKQIVEEGIKCLDKLQLIKILKFATFLQNYFNFMIVKVGGKDEKQKYERFERHSELRISDVKKVLDKVQTDFISQTFQLGNLSTNLSTPIHQLCSQLRIINSLKYSYLSRHLTIKQFHYLKYEIKQKFILIFLRYNMHYQLDLIFGDSQTKGKNFYHWAKNKIEKEKDGMKDGSRDTESMRSIKDLDSVKSGSGKKTSELNYESNVNSNNSSVIEKTDSFIYQSIIQKYESMKNNLTYNNQLFSSLAKYCCDRNKLSLGLKLLQHEQNAQRRILVGLLILTAKKDKSLVQKILEYTQKSKQSTIIYRVIKQLLNLKWIEKHLWTNIFHNKLKIQEHYIKYNQFTYGFENNKDYYLQNKMLVDLGYMGIKDIIREMAIQKIKRQEIVDLEKYPKEAIFDEVEGQMVKQKIVKEYQALIPTMCLNLKKHSNINKTNSGIEYLRKIKSQAQPITQQNLTALQSNIKLSDKQLQYLGQIILQKDPISNKSKQLAIKVFVKIRSQKVYKILLKQQKLKQCIDLAFQRKNIQQLKQLLQMVPELVMVGQDEEFMLAYTRDKIKELERRGLK